MMADCNVKMSHYVATCSHGTRGCIIDHGAVALGRRLMAISGYTPARGMLDMETRSVTMAVCGWVWLDGDHERVALGEFVPDLRQDASCGVLLGQVRTAFGDPSIHVMPAEDGRWYVWCGASVVEHRTALAYGNSEAEALVAAREVAPCD